jgi:hypothetical protein
MNTYKLGDLARIRSINDRSALTDLPDIDDPTGLQEAARLIYWAVCKKRVPASHPLRKQDGQPGWIWQGRIRDDVMDDLWPHLKDRMYVESERREEIVLALLRYLASSRVIICKNKGNNFNAAIYWVSDYWTPLEYTTVEEAHSEEPPEAPEEPNEPDEVGLCLPCRAGDPNCSREFPRATARMGHERYTHKVAVNDSGKVYSFEGFTSQDAEAVILDVLHSTGGLQNLRTIMHAAASADPRMIKPHVERALTDLTAGGFVESALVGSKLLYRITHTPVAQPDAEQPEVPAVMVDPEPEETVEGEFVSTASGLDEMNDLLVQSLKSLVAVSARLDRAKKEDVLKDERIAELERKLTAAEMRLVSQSNSPELARLREQVEELTQDRDDIKHRLEAWQQALQGLGVSK